MQGYKLALLVLLLIFGSTSLAMAITPTLTLSLNANEVVAGTGAGNQVLTATCTASDTCQIILASNGGVLSSGTTTTTFNLNSVAISANTNGNGYISLIGHDSSTPANSVTNSIRVLTATNAIKATVNNIQATPIGLGVSLEETFPSAQFALYESAKTANNMFLATTNGIVCPMWVEGNQINETNPNLQGADEVNIWTKATVQCGQIAKSTTNTLIIEFAAPGTNVWDGNLIGGNPALSEYNTANSFAGDDGASVFSVYNSFAGFGLAANSLPSGFTNNEMAVINFNNFTEFVSQGSPTWGAIYQASGPTVLNSGNAMDILGSTKILFGTTGDTGKPSAHSNKAVELNSNNCLNSGLLCVNIGGGYAGINTLTSEYTFENPPAYIPSCTLQNSIFGLTQTLGLTNNFWQGSPIVDNLFPFPYNANGKTNTFLGGTNSAATFNVPNLPFYKILFADNITNATTQINVFQHDNASGKAIIVYDLENSSNCVVEPPNGGGVCTPAWEQIYMKPSITNFCAVVHAAGFLCGLTIEVNNGAGVFSGYSNIGKIDYASVDYYDFQAQFDTPSGPAFTSLANVFANNVLVSGTNPNLMFTTQISTNNEQTPPDAPLTNTITSRQAGNFTNTVRNAQGLMVNFFPDILNCNTAGCTSQLLANDMQVFSSFNTVFNPNTLTQFAFYSLIDSGANTLLQFNNEFVQARTGTSGITANDFGFWGATGTVSNVMEIDQRVEPQNGIMPYWTLNTTGSITTPTVTANRIAVVGTQKLIFNINFTGGMYPYTYNFIITNSVTGAVVFNVLQKGINATYFGFPYVWNTLGTQQFPNITFTPAAGATYNVNAVVTDTNGKTVNSPIYYYGGDAFPGAKISISNAVVDAGQYEIFTGATSGGTYYSYTSNDLFSVFNSAGTSMNTFSLNNIATSAPQFNWLVPGFASGNTATGNVVIFGYTGNFVSQTVTSNNANSVKSASFTINPALLSTWTASNNPAGGAFQVLTATTDGATGTAPYTYNFQVYNSVGLVFTNTVTTSATSTFNAFVQNSAWGSGTFTANVKITDSASTPATITNTLTYTSSTSFSSTSWTISNTLTDQNNYEVLNGIISGGTTTYTYNFLVYNAVGTLVTNSLYSGVAATSNSYVFQMQSAWGTGTFTANLIVKDSASGTVTNTLTFTVNSALNANPPTPTTGKLDNGQSILLTSNPSGGSDSYTVYQWYTDSNNNCVSLTIIGGATSSTYSASPSSNTFYCYIVTDSLLGVATSSAPSNIVVYAAMNTPSISTPSPVNQVSGNTLTWVTTLTGGTSSYTYNWNVYNSVTGALMTNQLWAGNSFLGNTFSWITPLNTAGNSVFANVIITDSATSAVSINTINSGTINIIAASIPVLTIPSNEIIMGTPSDNQIISVACQASSTCKIQIAGTSTILSTGTTSSSFNGNTLGGSTYTCIYGNDITLSLISNTLCIRRIATTHNIDPKFTNNQGSNVLPNTPLMIVFNALNYTSFESNSLNNTVFAYTNGTVARSFLEGNQQNEQSLANTLYQATNVIFWLLSPPTNTFLPANTGVPNTNSINMYFDAVGNNLMDGNFIGEAPQLTCQNPTNTYACNPVGSLGYGTYDNGKFVFSLYDNFNGVSLNTSVWTSNTHGSGTFTINNGITFKVTNGNDWDYIISKNLLLLPQLYDFYLTQPSGANHAFGFTSANTVSGVGTTNACPYNGYGTEGGGNWRLGYCQSGSTSGLLGTPVTFTQLVPSMMTFRWNATGSFALYQNYTQKQVSTDTTFSLPSSDLIYAGIANGSTNNPVNVLYVRTRIMPPNDVMPAYTFNAGALQVPTLMLSNTLIDQGQSILFTATTVGGTGSYTYNYQIVNAVTGITIVNQLYKSVASTTNTFFWTPPANIYSANTFKANVIVTDATPTTQNSIYQSIGYNAAFSAAIGGWETSPGINAGQKEIIPHAGQGFGTPPFTFNYVVYNSVTNAVIFTSSAGTGQGFGFQVNWLIPLVDAYNTVYYNVIITDSASTPVTLISVLSSVVTINEPMATPSISTPFPLTQGTGNTLTWTTNLPPANAGTPPYTYNWLVINTITNAIFANMLETNSFIGNTFIYTLQTNDKGNTLAANVVITDNGAGPSPPFNNIVNSVESGTINVITANTMVTCNVAGSTTSNAVTYNTLLANTLVTCIGNNDGVIQYKLYKNNVNIATTTGGTTTYNALWDYNNDAYVWNTLGDGNFPAASTSFNVNSLLYDLTVGTNTIVYETFPENDFVNINITKAGANAIILFQENSITFNTQKENVQATNQIYNVFYTVNLINSNNLAWTANTLLSVTLSNGITESTVTINTIAQHIYWNYVPLVTINPPNTILGQNETISMNLISASGYRTASILGADVQIGVSANTITDSNPSPNIYNAFIYSFIPANYGLVNPTIGSPVAIPTNQILQLGFNNANVFRNTSFNFNSYQEAVVACGGGNTVTVNWNFFSTPSLAIDLANVLLQGFYTPSLNTYSGNTILGTSAGLTPVGGSNTYSTCIYPYWSNFFVTGSFTYNGVNTTLSNYYLSNQKISNTPTNIDLYLSNLTSPTSYEIAIENLSVTKYIAGIVQVLLYLPSTNTSVLINELKTVTNSGAFTELNLGSTYSFLAFSSLNSNILLGSVLGRQATSCAPSSCLLVIPVGSSNPGFLPTQITNFISNCTSVPNAGNTQTTSCIFTSLNSTSYLTQLRIKNTTGINNNPICIRNLTGISGTVSCTVSKINTTEYTWEFSVFFRGGWVQLSQGQFGTNTLLYGANGVIIALLITAVLSLLFIFVNLNAAIILAGLGLEVSAFIGAISLPLLAGGAFILLIGIVLYIINREG